MTSKKRRKGNKTVRKTREFLEERGYITDTCEKTSKFAKVKDLFGLFDVVAIKPDEVLFIQCKTNRPATKKPLIEFSNNYGAECYCFTWYDYKGFVVQIYKKGLTKPQKIDLRKS